jgi:hypothetical protein
MLTVLEVAAAFVVFDKVNVQEETDGAVLDS